MLYDFFPTCRTITLSVIRYFLIVLYLIRDESHVPVNIHTTSWHPSHTGPRSAVDSAWLAQRWFCAAHATRCRQCGTLCAPSRRVKWRAPWLSLHPKKENGWNWTKKSAPRHPDGNAIGSKTKYVGTSIGFFDILGNNGRHGCFDIELYNRSWNNDSWLLRHDRYYTRGRPHTQAADQRCYHNM